MTGRDLIMYILENGLENEPVIKDGRVVGFLTVSEAAARMNVGVETVLVWVKQGRLNGYIIGDIMYIPATSESPFSTINKGGLV